MVETFIKFEDEHKLFQQHLGEFYYWHYIRYGVYKRVFMSGTLSPRTKADRASIKDFLMMLRCALFRNTWFVHKHIDILAIGYPRKIKNPDGTREDPYIEPVVKNTAHTSLTVEVYSRQCGNIDSDPKYVKFIEDATLRSKIAAKCLRKKEKEVLYAEAKKIYDLFSAFQSPLTVEDIYHWFRGVMGMRKVFIPKFKRLLKKTTPNCIIATPGYTEMAMILNELALVRGIPTVEIEHGFFTEDAIPHNFYRKQEIKSYPQYFFANSQYKPDNVRFPIDNDHVKVVGSPYLEKRVANRKSQMIKGEIVLLDDNRYSDILLEFGEKLLEYIKENRLDYRITVKAHPVNKCNTPAWERAKKCADITCITGIMGKSVYDCLEEAEIVVGICSSTLFEAQAYGCRVYIIKDDASKVMGKFVEQGYGTYATNPADLFTPFDTADVKVLWHPDALNSTLREIDKLVEKSRGTLQ